MCRLERSDGWEQWYRWKEHLSVSQSAPNRRDAGCRQTTLMRWSIYMEIHSTASGWHVIGSTVCFKQKFQRWEGVSDFRWKNNDDWELALNLETRVGKECLNFFLSLKNHELLYLEIFIIFLKAVFSFHVLVSNWCTQSVQGYAYNSLYILHAMHSVPVFYIMLADNKPHKSLISNICIQAKHIVAHVGHIRLLHTLFCNLTASMKIGYGKINYVSGLMIWSENSPHRWQLYEPEYRNWLNMWLKKWSRIGCSVIFAKCEEKNAPHIS